MRNQGRFDRGRLFVTSTILLTLIAFGQGVMELRAEQPSAEQSDPQTLLEELTDLEISYEKSLAGGKLAEATATLKTIQVKRKELMGEDHWLVRTAGLQMQDLRAISALEPARRTQAIAIITKWRQALISVTPDQSPSLTTLLSELSTAIDSAVGIDSLQALELKMQSGQSLAAEGRFEEAREQMSQAVSRAQKLLGTTHPWYAHSLTLLATADSQLARWPEARREAALALRANEHLWGEESPPCGMNYLTLTWIDLQTNDFKAARRHADNARGCLERAREDDPINYALACSHMAEAMVGMGEKESARKQYTELVKFLDGHRMVPAPLQREICSRYATLLKSMGQAQDLKTVELRLAELDVSDQPVVR